jgi:hypothetical protein
MLTNSCGKLQQKDFWWTYLADYDGRPGSVLLNLSLKERAPITDFQQLIVTGVSYTPSSAEGLPDSKEIDWLNALGDKRLKIITQLTPSILAGTFTHNGERLDYIYVRTNAGVENSLKKFYQDNCPDRKPYINLKDDPKWQAYLEFLFPNEQTIQFNRHELIKIGYLKN